MQRLITLLALGLLFLIIFAATLAYAQINQPDLVVSPEQSVLASEVPVPRVRPTQSTPPSPPEVPTIVPAPTTIVLSQQTSPSPSQWQILYDGTREGEKPDDQGFFSYQAATRQPPLAADTLYEAGGTTMRSLTQLADYAGYIGFLAEPQILTRTVGYTLTMTVELLAETHASPDRAGFSLLILDNASWGVELAFWEDQIWAQNDGIRDPGPLFTRGETVPFTPMLRPFTYTLAVQGDQYRLIADATTILTGPLRRYEPVLSIENPLRLIYYQSNLIFLGDNTSAAGANVRLHYVALDNALLSSTPAASRLFIPLLRR
ncbi:hypothetical protein EYB53_002665 [Candidatus Chloroploca sp. M-50]|uniref:Uncharacterized protein n=1 Tax=Candidatus Chloroploca mongolica TaxID=2528176 RepID=A0ABS4D5A7_9CHLR|nr:hypothetical protein [Candidatus Chloroploca mongolica]MBP1464604.1 hypothetical protein [Candidatus Chloroploca mongolica]